MAGTLPHLQRSVDIVIRLLHHVKEGASGVPRDLYELTVDVEPVTVHRGSRARVAENAAQDSGYPLAKDGAALLAPFDHVTKDLEAVTRNTIKIM